MYGSSKSKDIFPDSHSAIEVLDFKNPKDLADYLHFLDKNDTEYEKYLAFKKPGGVTNKIVRNLISQREWGINNDRTRVSMIDSFECMICDRLYNNMELEQRGEPIKKRQASLDHYGCPYPYTFSPDGILLDEKYRDKPEWQDNLFKTTFELAYISQKLFFQKYYSSEEGLRLKYKDFQNEVLKYHRDVFLARDEKIDL